MKLKENKLQIKTRLTCINIMFNIKFTPTAIIFVALFPKLKDLIEHVGIQKTSLFELVT